MSPQASAEPLTFANALSQACFKCKRPWQDHRLWSFASVETGQASASLEFTVDCPPREAP